MSFPHPGSSSPNKQHTETSDLGNAKLYSATSTTRDLDTQVSASSSPRSSSAQPITPFVPHDSLEAASSHGPRLYKRRFFGLAQLSLLNIMVSWIWLTFAPVSDTSATYFSVSISTINWLSTGFLFAFVAAAPVALWTLNRYGPRGAIVTASVLIVLSSWLRYAGAKARQDGNGVFGLVVFGQVLGGLAQPFVLSAPAFYSELWFSEKGRITATAVASLANPLGGALGQLIDPFWVTKPSEIPNMVLYVAIICTATCIPSFFVPSRPPTPPTATSLTAPPRITYATITCLLLNPTALMLLVPFTIYVSAFNATSSLLVPILMPHNFSETEAGIAGALLILVGLVAAAISSPILDRHPRLRLPVIRTLVPVIAAMYLALVWVPSTGSVGGVYVLMAVLGAASFTLVPLVLESLVDFTWPEVGPEVSSTIAWACCQLGGGIWIVVMDALGEGSNNGDGDGRPAALIWQAVWACVIMPVPLCLGLWGTGRSRRGDARRTVDHS